MAALGNLVVVVPQAGSVEGASVQLSWTARLWGGRGRGQPPPSPSSPAAPTHDLGRQVGRGSDAKSSPQQGRAPPWGYNTQLTTPWPSPRPSLTPAANTAQLCPSPGEKGGHRRSHSTALWGNEESLRFPQGSRGWRRLWRTTAMAGSSAPSLGHNWVPCPEKELHLHTGCLAASFAY